MAVQHRSAEDSSNRIVTIAQAQATIEAIRVNGKAMTLALFEQLEWEFPGKWEVITPYHVTFRQVRGYSHPKPVEDMTYVIDDDVELWGYVRRMHRPRWRSYHGMKEPKPVMMRHYLFTRKGKLYKCVEPQPDIYDSPYGQGQIYSFAEAMAALTQLYIAV